MGGLSWQYRFSFVEHVYFELEEMTVFSNDLAPADKVSGRNITEISFDFLKQSKPLPIVLIFMSFLRCLVLSLN